MGRYAVEIPVADEKYSLELLEGPGLISTSPLNINKRLQRHTRTHTTILWNRKNGT